MVGIGGISTRKKGLKSYSALENAQVSRIQNHAQFVSFEQHPMYHLTLKSAERRRERSSSSMKSLASLPSRGSSVLLHIYVFLYIEYADGLFY
jgi:hypothetical protein